MLYIHSFPSALAERAAVFTGPAAYMKKVVAAAVTATALPTASDMASDEPTEPEALAEASEPEASVEASPLEPVDLVVESPDSEPTVLVLPEVEPPVEPVSIVVSRAPEPVPEVVADDPEAAVLVAAVEPEAPVLVASWAAATATMAARRRALKNFILRRRRVEEGGRLEYKLASCGMRRQQAGHGSAGRMERAGTVRPRWRQGKLARTVLFACRGISSQTIRIRSEKPVVVTHVVRLYQSRQVYKHQVKPEDRRALQRQPHARGWGYSCYTQRPYGFCGRDHVGRRRSQSITCGELKLRPRDVLALQTRGNSLLAAAQNNGCRRFNNQQAHRKTKLQNAIVSSPTASRRDDETPRRVALYLG